MSILFLILVIAPFTQKEEPIEVVKDPVDIVEETPDEVNLVEEVITEIPTAPEKETSQETYYKIVSVTDGDTLKISMNGKTETLRLIGIDTPETVDPRKPVQCFGTEASNKAKQLLTGKNVRLEYDESQGDRDRYQRLLVYIHIEDGTFFNQYMIEQGYAHEYTYNTPYKYQSEFKQAEAKAKSDQSGLWSPNTCNGDTSSVPEPISNSEDNTSAYYTSSHYSAKHYYPAECSDWENLSTSYLKSFDSLENLLDQYQRTLSPQCQ